ncbi:MAG: zinc-binding dehydrogenase [Candidatus Velthaea sp.]
MRDGGHLCELVGEDVPEQRGIRIFHTQSKPSAQRLSELAGYFEAGTLRVEIARTFPLSQAREAHAMVEQRQTRGKMVLTVD